MRTKILRIIDTVNSHHTGAYAAQAAYFFVLSLIPIFLASAYYGTVYSGDYERCDGGGSAGVSSVL